MIALRATKIALVGAIALFAILVVMPDADVERRSPAVN
jgi:hypothetical protein